MEGWNGNGRGPGPKGRGRRVTPEEKQAEWRRLSDRAYSPLCFRSQARPAGSSFPLHTPHTRTYTCAYARGSSFPSRRVSAACRAHSHPSSTLVAASWTFPFDFRDTALGAVTRALRCRSPLASFLSISLPLSPRVFSSPRHRVVRLLRIRRIRELIATGATIALW